MTCLACSEATATPAVTSTPASSAVAPSATATAGDKTYRASELPAIALSESQMVGWQTATRPDLTGPFMAATNTNPQENPAPATGLQAGYRQTIGDPGAPGVNTVRTILELFDSPAVTRAALAATVKGYEGAGYTQLVDPSALGLGPETAARSGSNVPVAPQFAQGNVKQGIVVLWRSGNLLLIQVDGGDSGVTLDTAARWIGPVNASARARGS